jgi:hypothetical protein
VLEEWPFRSHCRSRVAKEYKCHVSNQCKINLRARRQCYVTSHPSSANRRQ